MIYDHEARPNGVSPLTGEVLSEAMPWIKNVTGKTIVIKYGGAAMVDEDLRAGVMADIVLLKIIGVNPVIVHGGGKAISRAMDDAGIPVEFVDGQRVTTPEAMDIVRTVLTGEVNQELVEAMHRHGSMAVGLSGTDASTIVAEPADPRLGRVGRITSINPALIHDLVAADYIPVIASVAVGADGGAFNINADVAAGHVAAAIGAHKVVFLTDVDGLLMDYPDPASLVSAMTLDETRQLIETDAVASGMIPKLGSTRCCSSCLPTRASAPWWRVWPQCPPRSTNRSWAASPPSWRTTNSRSMTAFIREETPCMPNQYGKKRIAPFAAAQREVWDFESS